jgi:hypothetical protein
MNPELPHGLAPKNKVMQSRLPQEVLEAVRATLEGNYPTLALHYHDAASFIEGVVQLEHKGSCFDSFLVHIELLPGYSREMPKAFEVGDACPETPNIMSIKMAAYVSEFPRNCGFECEAALRSMLSSNLH